MALSTETLEISALILACAEPFITSLEGWQSKEKPISSYSEYEGTYAGLPMGILRLGRVPPPSNGGSYSVKPSSIFSSIAMSLNSLDSKTSRHSKHSTNSASSSRATICTRGWIHDLVSRAFPDFLSGVCAAGLFSAGGAEAGRCESGERGTVLISSKVFASPLLAAGKLGGENPVPP